MDSMRMATMESVRISVADSVKIAAIMRLAEGSKWSQQCQNCRGVVLMLVQCTEDLSNGRDRLIIATADRFWGLQRGLDGPWLQLIGMDSYPGCQWIV